MVRCTLYHWCHSWATHEHEGHPLCLSHYIRGMGILVDNVCQPKPEPCDMRQDVRHDRFYALDDDSPWGQKALRDWEDASLESQV